MEKATAPDLKHAQAFLQLKIGLAVVNHDGSLTMYQRPRK